MRKHAKNHIIISTKNIESVQCPKCSTIDYSLFIILQIAQNYNIFPGKSDIANM